MILEGPRSGEEELVVDALYLQFRKGPGSLFDSREVEFVVVVVSICFRNVERKLSEPMEHTPSSTAELFSLLLINKLFSRGYEIMLRPIIMYLSALMYSSASNKQTIQLPTRCSVSASPT